DGSRTRGRLLPDTAPPVARIATVHDLGGDRLFVVYSDGAWGTRDPDRGFVVFNLRTMTMERQGSVPPAESYLPRGESVFVLRENRVEVLDLAGGQPRVLTDSVEPGVEVLLPGR
ncbi:MAG: hypothetical protein HYX51_09695, partial [Chloroflexi bacterium]|nr:hypothetical protein [Chloroflexota bacterium]